MSDILLNFLHEFNNVNWEYEVTIVPYEDRGYDYILNLTTYYERGEGERSSLDWGPIIRHAGEFEKFDPQTFVNGGFHYNIRDDVSEDLGSHCVEIKVKE